MIKFTTKEAGKLLYTDDARSNGCPEVCFFENESQTFEVEATISEVEAFEQYFEVDVDSDVIPDLLFDALVEFLNVNRLLDKPIQ
jgi:hypothetical protein